MERVDRSDAVGRGGCGTKRDRVPIFRFLAADDCWSSHLMNTFASVTCVVSFRPCANGISLTLRAFFASQALRSLVYSSRVRSRNERVSSVVFWDHVRIPPFGSLTEPFPCSKF
jgi:hypothetical protein